MLRNGLSLKIISVLTKLHEGFPPEEFYDWIVRERIRAINARPVSSSREENPMHDKFFPDFDKLAKWYIELYEIWKSRSDGVVLYPAELWIQAFAMREQYSGLCALKGGTCYKYLGIDHKGDVYVCDRMVIRLDNINRVQRLEDLLFHPRLKQIYVRLTLFAQLIKNAQVASFGIIVWEVALTTPLSMEISFKGTPCANTIEN
nr:TPA: hypothetical protein PAB1917 [Pyrococcus abyssi GE5]